MNFELYPTITLRSRSFNVLQALRELFEQEIGKQNGQAASALA